MSCPRSGMGTGMVRAGWLPGQSRCHLGALTGTVELCRQGVPRRVQPVRKGTRGTGSTILQEPGMWAHCAMRLSSPWAGGKPLSQLSAPHQVLSGAGWQQEFFCQRPAVGSGCCAPCCVPAGQEPEGLGWGAGWGWRQGSWEQLLSELMPPECPRRPLPPVPLVTAQALPGTPCPSSH